VSTGRPGLRLALIPMGVVLCCPVRRRREARGGCFNEHPRRLEILMAYDPRGGGSRSDYKKVGEGGKNYVDYKSSEELRRLMTPNGKIYSRKRLGVTAREQRQVARAIKRARYMALLPYTSATL
jgi:small subunit ribosomal protein S18